jgi:hypothetical protein
MVFPLPFPQMARIRSLNIGLRVRKKQTVNQKQFAYQRSTGDAGSVQRRQQALQEATVLSRRARKGVI